ncbi:MAG: DUF222 domain-containing protein [Acidimicrobiia bacterium]|nr:DUF222 domain-containing protein [Acidimicrobiia bacterium]MDX2468740.1 DUF222 domain-containing protein [Acidimicrobiia bacterium]
MLFTDPTLVSDFKAELAETSNKVSQLHARQLVIINQLQRAGVAGEDGARSMVDWTASAMDISHHSARQLVDAANRMYREDPYLFEELEAGDITLDRAMATIRLLGANAPESVVDRSFDLDLTAVNRLTHQYRRISRKDDQQTFSDRHFVIQPSLDETRWTGYFELPAVEGSIVDQAIAERADELRRQPGGDYYTRSQLQADALVMISQDSLTDETATGSGGGFDGTVFIDLERASSSGGELGAELEYGPRVGPSVLKEILCGSSVQLIGLENGKPIVTSQSASAVPPAVRKFVAWRDKGCTVAGCHSRYRLQAHHIRHRAHQGDHDPDNLATLCWFHHHIAIHQTGFTLHPDDPPGCRRLVRPNRGHDPPHR